MSKIIYFEFYVKFCKVHHNNIKGEASGHYNPYLRQQRSDKENDLVINSNNEENEERFSPEATEILQGVSDRKRKTITVDYDPYLKRIEFSSPQILKFSVFFSIDQFPFMQTW